MNTTNPFEKCYAKCLGGCTHKTREHFISESVLKVIGPLVTITGFPWLSTGESRHLSTGSIAAGVLCDRHNSSLSPYDAEAAKFFGHLKLLDSKATPQSLAQTPALLSIDGILLEKWLLKTLCGIIASGNYQLEGKSFGKVPPSEYMVNLLFSNDPWARGVGLFMYYPGIERINAQRGIGFDPVLTKSPGSTNAEIVGIDIQLWGFPFRGLFVNYADGQPVHSGYRPVNMRIMNEDVEREIPFIWPAESSTSEGPVFRRDGTIY